ncbi:MULTISPECIES: hypothetical protein [unclassified Spirosoma]|nr:MULTISPECIES: hypothetical protein [unclassified Spirosoma]
MAKAPRKPKKSAPLSSWENYDAKKAEYDKNKKKKDALVKKHSK